MNIAGLGMAQHAPNRENALRLMEFLTSAAAQTHIAANNSEFPVSPDLEAPESVKAYAGFAAHPMGAAAFARRQPEAQAVMSAAGWR